MDFISLIEGSGLAVAALVAVSWFMYHSIKEERVKASEREDRLLNIVESFESKVESFEKTLVRINTSLDVRLGNVEDDIQDLKQKIG